MVVNSGQLFRSVSFERRIVQGVFRLMLTVNIAAEIITKECERTFVPGGRFEFSFSFGGHIQYIDTQIHTGE